MKTAISLFLILTFAATQLGGIHLKCLPKDTEEKHARWNKEPFWGEGFMYVYVQGQVFCPDGSEPEGSVELWEWDEPDNEDDQATNGLCGYQSNLRMNFFEVDGYVKDSRGAKGWFFGEWTGFPEPYLWIQAKCRNGEYRVKWYLGCYTMGKGEVKWYQGPIADWRNREDFVFENYKVFLARVSPGQKTTTYNEKTCG
ncbi:hypothetical protein AAVH_25605 [Aphelenchoides avenae]|nr:hypothetical protein AAVH_25605 [Aphelenchus avenae]